MLAEQVTGRNPFHVLGLPEFSAIRDGRLRSQGPFAVSITAGTFGATVMPLFISLWWSRVSSRLLILVGVVSATIITVTSASSGPTFTYFAAVTGLLAWPLRKRMYLIRWGLALLLISLHLVMNAPVWALINRIAVVSGSSSYHRYKLIDNFITRFDEWWLIGTKSTAHWGWMMWDTVNQYVLQGITGGLLSLILFLSIIGLSFNSVGRRLHSTATDRDEARRLWAFGVALFAHIIAFIGISYFDQVAVIWYLLIAMMSTLREVPDTEAALKRPLTTSLRSPSLHESVARVTLSPR
jgi:hypothetical protein